MIHLNCGSFGRTNIGDIVQFGNYHGALDWIVLDGRDNKLLLITRDCIDSLPYDSKRGACFWEFCSLREWLNSGFINEAFSEEEQKMIVLTEVIIDDHKRTPAHSTSDRAFFLSCKECFAYFSHEKVKNAIIKHLAEKEVFSSLEKGEEKRFFDGCYWQSCLPSEYAIQVSSDNTLLPFCEWWLRATEYISEEEIKSNYYLNTDYDDCDSGPEIFTDGELFEC